MIRIRVSSVVMLLIFFSVISFAVGVNLTDTLHECVIPEPSCPEKEETMLDQMANGTWEYSDERQGNKTSRRVSVP